MLFTVDENESAITAIVRSVENKCFQDIAKVINNHFPDIHCSADDVSEKLHELIQKSAAYDNIVDSEKTVPLTPCKFCGKKPVYELERTESKQLLYRVSCITDSCLRNPKTDWWFNRLSAANRWNEDTNKTVSVEPLNNSNIGGYSIDVELS